MAASLLFTKTVGCLALLGQVAWADEVSLIQDVKTNMAVNRPTQHTATTLLERASSMLKNGATEDVTLFVNEIWHNIHNAVMPKINNASAEDQILINSNFAEFDIVLDRLVVENGLLRLRGEAEAKASVAHKACRVNENTACESKRTCDKELFGLWNMWYTAEGSLLDTHGAFSLNFCSAQDSGHPIFRTQTSDTNSFFRDQASIDMKLYIADEKTARDRNEKYTKETLKCEALYTALETLGSSCNNLQISLEQHSCGYADEIHSTVSEFHNSWKNALDAYNLQVNAVKQLQDDRILEHSTLEIVKCLLDSVKSRAGQPCNEDTGEFEQEKAKCQDVHVEAQQNTTHLVLTYPNVPAKPEQCLSRHDVGLTTGPVCLPVVQPVPCSGSWITQEFSTVSFPVSTQEAPFGPDNPSCNSALACVQCPHHD